MLLKNQITKQADSDLIARICEKDKKALDALYEKYAGKMLGLACHILQNKDDAEDVVHDVFIEIWNKAKTFDAKKATVLGWIMLRVRSRSIDTIRKHNTKQKYLEKQKNEIKIQSNSATDAYTDNKFLNKSLNILSKKQRLIIELNYFKGLSCAEISQKCAIPLGTVKTRLLSALQKMQTLVKKESFK